MKKFFIMFLLLGFSTTYSQQASTYFPTQSGFVWTYKTTVLDSLNNTIDSLVLYEIDSFAVSANYQGRLANIVPNKTGTLQTVPFQPYIDTSFYNFSGTDGFEYFNIGTLENLLLQLDSLNIDPNFSFLTFFRSLQNWYSAYRFASPVNSEYELFRKDTLISTYNLRFQFLGRRLADESIQTQLGQFNCKKFLLQMKLSLVLPFPLPALPLFTTNETIWIAPNHWIVQEFTPTNHVDLSLLGVPKFSIPGSKTEIINNITDIDDLEILPDEFYLSQNYPNPFNPVTKIRYEIPLGFAASPFNKGGIEGGLITLKIYDVLGNEVAILVNEYKPAGVYEVEFNVAQSADGGYSPAITSGVYFYQLQAGALTQTKKMILIK